jgi:hypothetical protein
MNNRSLFDLRRGTMWFVALAAAIGLASIDRLGAETWTDNTGNFKIEAEFVAIKGDKVVLKKANGTTLEVPLRRLNPAGQELAKKLSAKPASPATTVVPAPATAPASSANQSPDAYVRALGAAADAGDYQKLWNAFPQSYQKDVHDVIHSFAENMDAPLWNQISGVLKKAVKLLKDKREFILGHPQVAPQRAELAKSLPLVTDALDALINSELTDLEKLKTIDLPKFAAGNGKKIADKMKAASEAAEELQKFAPPVPGGPDGNPFAELGKMKLADVKITLVKHEGDSAVLKFEPPGKPESKEVEFVRIDGKWLPKDMVDGWQAGIAKAKEWTSTEMKQQLEGVKANAGFFMAPINLTLDQLLAAQTQEQFNQVITNLEQQFGRGAPPPM